MEKKKSREKLEQGNIFIEIKTKEDTTDIFNGQKIINGVSVKWLLPY